MRAWSACRAVRSDCLVGTMPDTDKGRIKCSGSAVKGQWKCSERAVERTVERAVERTVERAVERAVERR